MKNITTFNRLGGFPTLSIFSEDKVKISKISEDLKFDEIRQESLARVTGQYNRNI